MPSQEGKPVAFLNEKLNHSLTRYSTYDKELYAIVRASNHWRHYLICEEFILFPDHEVLRLSGQNKLNIRAMLGRLNFCKLNYIVHTKHKFGKMNQVADALSIRHTLLNTIQLKVIGFEVLQKLYQEDSFFKKIWAECSTGTCDSCYTRRLSFQRSSILYSKEFIERVHYY